MGCGSSSGRSTPPAEPAQKKPEQPEAQPERDWLAEKPSAWIAEVAEDAEQQAELAPVRNQCAALGVVTFGDMQRLSAEARTPRAAKAHTSLQCGVQGASGSCGAVKPEPIQCLMYFA